MSLARIDTIAGPTAARGFVDVLTRRTGIGAWGLASTTCAVAAVVVSMAAFPGYSPAECFISRLGGLESPLRWVFNGGLVVAGLLSLPFMSSLHRIADNPHGRLAARAGTVASIGMVLTGVFPSDLRAPHMTAAALMFCSATVATYAMAMAFERRSLRPHRRRIPKPSGRIALCGFVFQLVLCVSGVAYAGIRAAQLRGGSLKQVLSSLGSNLAVQLGPRVTPINPAAVLEWVFFAATVSLVAALSLYCIRKRY